ncbi:MAG: cobalamin biosynthesis protein CobW [Alphaproteobacteria bacterium]|nr:cobalamin biosynthesis protein CobW [Alphaproteobacteria bacterium]MBF0250742.1 cobalamin biosynthesis protein CobW [Alphaproteobacteria bacterium]
MSKRTKIPATVITGFLGAGKTTLIRHMLENAGGRRIALVINEFGDLGIDREIVRGCGIASCRDEDVVELANGCICCTVADDFLPVMEALVERADPPEHIVIETSGLALPKPLIRAFNWPEIKTRVTVDGVVAVVDGPALAAGQFAANEAAVQAQREADASLNHENPLEDLFEDQVHAADMVLLNKADLLDEAEADRLIAELTRQLRPGVHVVKTSHGNVGVDVLLGLDAAAEDDLDARHAHHDHHHDHDHDDDHDHDQTDTLIHQHDHDHDDFESFVVDVPAQGDPARLEARLIDIVTAHNVLRVKGFVEVTGKPMRHVVQGVGARFTRYFDRPWGVDEDRRGRLVVIGQAGLDRAAITAALQDSAA